MLHKHAVFKKNDMILAFLQHMKTVKIFDFLTTNDTMPEILQYAK
jgi:hypothetical protein